MSAAEQRAADGGDGHHAAEVAVVPAPLPRRDHRGDDDLDERLQAADADALEGAGGDQLAGVLGEPATSEPTTKITMAIWTSSFLLNRSASLPQIGVVGGRGEQGGGDHPGVLGLACRAAHR